MKAGLCKERLLQEAVDLRQINIHMSGVHCVSAVHSGASELPYYCTPRVCISAVTELLAVWRHNKLFFLI